MTAALVLSMMMPSWEPIPGRLWCVDVARRQAIIRTGGENRRTVRVPVVPGRVLIPVGHGSPTVAELRAISDAWRDSPSILYAWYYPMTGNLTVGIIPGRDGPAFPNGPQ